MEELKQDMIEKMYQTKQPIIFNTSNTTLEFMDEVEKVLSIILKNKNFQHIKSNLSFIIKELVANCNKANLKRVYFKLNNLFINMPGDYEHGMKKFANIIRENQFQIESYLEEYEMFVKIVFEEYADRVFRLIIENNSAITEQEKRRINEKIQYYEENKSNVDVYDDTEGSGLGIFLTLKMLFQAGINPDAFSIKSENGITITEINFNYNEIEPPPYNIVAQEILKELKTLPKYPKNIKEILTKLLDPNISINEISDDIEKDPTLSADLLKLVNSAKFMLNRKIASIKEGINIIGLKGLKNLLFSYGAMQIVNNRFGSMPVIWMHCYKTARIAAKIAKLLKICKDDDEFFTAGLLHDIGKIVLMSFDKEKALKIEQICKKRGVDIPLMEEIMMGLSHARIGGEITKYWDFPESLINAISFHHDPIMSPSDKELVNTVYLANFIANAKNEQDLIIHTVEEEAKEFFNIRTTAQLVNFANKVENYQIQNI